MSRTIGLKPLHRCRILNLLRRIPFLMFDMIRVFDVARVVCGKYFVDMASSARKKFL